MQRPAIPVIDLSKAIPANHASWQSTADQIRVACESTGFFIITGHSVSSTSLQEARRAAQAFFKLPDAEKRKSFLAGHGRGYLPFAAERLGATTGDTGSGDLKESFNVPSDFSTITWPEVPENFRKTLEELFGEMSAVIAQLMDLSATALALPPEYFRASLVHSKAILRATNYPPVTETASLSGTRASAHTDYGTLTILSPDEKVGGLQIQLRDGTWIDVVCPSGAFVINVGDLMEHWTNGLWRSTPHRVVIPEGSEYGREQRLSLVLLHNPNPDTMVEPLPTCVSEENPAKYPPMRAGDHLKEKSEKSRNLTVK